MALREWNYEKLDEDGNIKRCPANDLKGEITGKLIIGLQEYFDENPDERIRLGWIKHIRHDPKEVEYNRQTQYLERGTRQIDEFTVEDEYYVFDKTEEMLLLEEMLDALDAGGSAIIFTGMEEP